MTFAITSIGPNKKQHREFIPVPGPPAIHFIRAIGGMVIDKSAMRSYIYVQTFSVNNTKDLTNAAFIR